MANFTDEIRKDLLKTTPRDEETALPFLAGFFDTSGTITPQTVSFTSENERTAETILSLVEKTFSAGMTVTEANRDPKHGKIKLSFACYGKEAKLLAGGLLSAAALRILDDNNMMRAYFQGAFLGGGSCTLPRDEAKTGYHFEVIFPSEKKVQAFSDLLTSLNLLGRTITRNEKHVIYFKSREIISDALWLIGAEGALKTLQSVSSEREENNNNNRVSNCIAFNADKTAIASAAQSMAFRKMQEDGTLESLSEELRKTAEARLSRPALSLVELAEELGISKSCLYHRIRKLMEIYAKTEIRS